MGNCFVCFKAPATTGLDSTTQFNNREDMPEAQLYPAPSHVPASSGEAQDSTATILSNGNHVHVSAHHCVPISTSAGPTLTSGAYDTSTDKTGGASITRFYQYSRRNCSRSAPSMGAQESKPSDGKVTALFEQYKDEQEDAILAEGIEQFCKDLQVSPDDFKILVLAWKLNAEQMCCFTRTEFVEGLKSIRADTIKTISNRLPELANEVENSSELFKDLYRFTFKFGLDTNCGQRILPLDMAVILWRLVFTVREPPILQRWLNYLETHDNIRGIPRDTWNMFLNFSETVATDLSSYDDAEAWPSLFDDFVEYENDQANQNIVKDKDIDSIIKQNE